tara:strand:+ start:84 stop:575 length:492 start_codon:yes stop_codon:yes gene_type:complete
MKIGFVVKNLSASQLAYFLCDNLNNCCKNSYKNDYVVFTQNKSQKMKPNNFALLNSSELWGFDGVLIATCVSTAMEVVKSVNPAKKYFYVWDLEWCRSHLMGLQQRRDYITTVQAFSHPSMNLIARSPSHAAAIKNYCNKEVCGIVDDFNITELKQVIKNEIC